MANFKENILFLREAFTEFENTGSLFPTSRWAAQALALPLKKRNGPRHILELGPGNGSVTTEILDQMIDGDTLTICEINPRFMHTLKNRIRKLPSFQRRRKQITFHTCPAQQLPEDRKFDIIICALPFLNFELQVVEEIFAKIRSIAAPNAEMSYYEFIGIRPFSMFFSPPKRKQRIKELDVFFDELSRRCSTRRKHVWLNVLPIHIYSLQIAA